ncbi:hypothetical protein PF002_g26668 [Phytophthora fragariae]|uniref:Uncharacterized protein n=1 Tax=Phytophthora fragariae TaxID=53985 RepID=A0A6A3I671_9STRA|nr:hypothetical protein PF011_g24351 [Phytophthora fragariae]KAE9183565.1 hypothetical protein PF002_g26668 [Phytophthora fragariae]
MQLPVGGEGVADVMGLLGARYRNADVGVMIDVRDVSFGSDVEFNCPFEV